MKTNLRFTLPFKLMAALILSAGLITGCSKDDNNGLKPPAQTSALAWFHAAGNTDSLHIFVDEKQTPKDPIGYQDSVKYAELLSGERAIEIKNKEDESVLDDTVAFEENTVYSVFIIEGAEEGLELVQIKDELDAPEEDHAQIRLVHVASDAPALQLVAEETVVVDETDFKKGSAFQNVEAQTTSFQIVNADDETELLTIEDMELEAGKTYTIWVSGQYEAADPAKALKANIFVNK